MRVRDEKRLVKLNSVKDQNESNLIKLNSACSKLSSCNVFGQNTDCSLCVECNEIVKTQCKEVSKTYKTKKIRSERPWDYVVSELFADSIRKEIVAYCVNTCKMTESASKDFVNSAGCVVNNLKGKGKKDGLVNNYCSYLLKGKKGNEPQGSKNLIYYCKRVFATCMSNEDIKIQLIDC